MSSKKTLEINPTNAIMEELRKRSEVGCCFKTACSCCFCGLDAMPHQHAIMEELRKRSKVGDYQRLTVHLTAAPVHLLSCTVHRSALLPHTSARSTRLRHTVCIHQRGRRRRPGIDISRQGVSHTTFAVPALERSPFAGLERCCGSPSLDV